MSFWEAFAELLITIIGTIRIIERNIEKAKRRNAANKEVLHD